MFNGSDNFYRTDKSKSQDKQINMVNNKMTISCKFTNFQEVQWDQQPLGGFMGAVVIPIPYP